MTFKTYKPKREPRDYQKQAVNKLWLQRYGGALFMQPRTGKTKTTIEYMNVLTHANKIKRVLIIAPRITFNVWLTELEQDCVSTYRVDVWDATARATGTFPKSGPEKLHIVLTNYEAFSSKSSTAGRGRIANRKLCENWLQGGSLIVLDESHRIKNANTHMGRNIIKLGTKGEYRVICTGTPITKTERVKDIYNQFLFLNPKCLSPWATVSDFEDTFTINQRTAGGWKNYLGLKNEAMLQRLIDSQSFRITRAECMDLPERIVETVPVTLTPKTTRIYNQLVAELIAPLNELGAMGATRKAYVEASLPVTLNLRLTQITGGFAGVTQNGVTEVVKVGSEKLDVLRDLIAMCTENGEKVVVCARFVPEIKAIIMMCGAQKVPVWGIWGEKTAAERDEGIKAFTVSNTGVMVIQPSAGGVGIDLSTASNLVWYSLPNSFVDFTQANDRVALNPAGVTIYYLIATGTIDEMSLTALRASHEASHGLLDNPRGLFMENI